MDHHMRSAAGVKCGRWNPTAEQVKVLTDLFSSGLRTPTTEQIQMISSHLSSFGKIESKNVFYWFQNHKARERHYRKRRRAGGGDLCCRVPAADHVKKEARSCASTTSEQEVMINLERKERDQIETLELFPLMSDDSTTTTTNNNYNSLEGSAAAAAAAAEKFWRTRSISTSSVWKEWRGEMPPFVFDINTDEISDPPPLDLRLSFL